MTAFDEMEELAIAGRLGWRTVSAGLLRHRVVRTDTQWEHRRVLWRKAPSSYEQDGWQMGCRAFPWLYLVRDTGLPVASGLAVLQDLPHQLRRPRRASCRP